MPIEFLEETLQTFLASFLPDNALSTFLVEHALLTFTLSSALVVLIILLVSFFFDFIADAWKLPFGAAVDVLTYLGLFNPWFAAGGAVLALFVFLRLSDAGMMRWPFALLTVGAALIVFLNNSSFSLLAAFLPLGTILMFVSAIID